MDFSSFMKSFKLQIYDVFLSRPTLKSGRFSEVLFNIGELRGTHAYDLRNDKSHRPGASGGLVWWFSRKLALWRLFLTRWVPYDGYIRHQNDHLSGRMTDISVMGEWQVVGVGGARPLRNVLGEVLRGRFSFEARNYLFSFPSYVHLEEFFVSRAFAKFGAKLSSPEAFGLISTMSWSSFWKLRSVTRHFLANSDYDHEYFFENFFSFFKAEPVLLARQPWWSPGWAKFFGRGSSKTRMETWFPGVGEIERRRTVDRRRV